MWLPVGCQDLHPQIGFHLFREMSRVGKKVCVLSSDFSVYQNVYTEPGSLEYSICEHMRNLDKQCRYTESCGYLNQFAQGFSNAKVSSRDLEFNGNLEVALGVAQAIIDPARNFGINFDHAVQFLESPASYELPKVRYQVVTIE